MSHENTCRTGICPVRVAGYSVALAGLAALGALALVLGAAGARAGGLGATSELDGPKARPGTTPDLSTNPGPGLAVVELFTSEGCSSCPPADAVLDELAKTDPGRDGSLILLSWHVDYWDNLGWKDPYSSAFASTRQRDYNDALAERPNAGRPGVYTPQTIINGIYGFVGSDAVTARRRIADARADVPAPALGLAVAPRKPGEPVQITVTVPAEQVIPAPAEWLAVLLENEAITQVKRGENGGRSLTHARVVRAHATKPATTAREVTFTLTPPPTFTESGARVAIILQSPGPGAIVNAGSIPLPN